MVDGIQLMKTIQRQIFFVNNIVNIVFAGQASVNYSMRVYECIYRYFRNLKIPK